HPDRVKALKDAGAETMASRRNGPLRPNGLTDRLMFDGLIPTPQAWDGMRGGQTVTGRSKTQPCGETFSSNLNDLAKSGLLPNPAGTRSGHTPKTSGATFQLNPRYVMEMMNFPTDYLELPFQNGE
ncbi:MAG: hypothetical protein LUD72_01445, partial [Bacteroidales bacterium]|nr:hypothetical protein [Bacteroidales bacterium]